MRRQGAVASAEDTAQAGSTETSPMGRGLTAADFTWDAPFPGYTTLLGGDISREKSEPAPYQWRRS
ncbi:hypothetical protein AB0C27_53135 [Nonomuraea sp. NPDC048882]|uniref:hypothetical protein n=1 Tax=unclassified Nonomuraea TaxID=2593643 RepID=UPI000A769886